MNVLTKEQLRFLEEVETGARNLQLQSVAGSGKTSTLLLSLPKIPTDQKVLFVCFSKPVQEELELKVPKGVDARTLHSLGYSIVSSQLGWFKLNTRKVENLLKYKVLHGTPADTAFFYKHKRTLVEVIDKLREKFISPEDLSSELQAYMDDNVSEDRAEWKSIASLLYKESCVFGEGKGTKTIDFLDLIFLPLYFALDFPQYDVIYVDEAQDLSSLHRAFIEKLLKAEGRILVAGDPFQSIYGFNGADPDSMFKFKEFFNTKLLSLSTSFRCSKEVVKEATRIVPHMRCGRDSIGEVGELSLDEVKDSLSPNSNLILCRVNAPLFSLCLSFIARGTPAKILGKCFDLSSCSTFLPSRTPLTRVDVQQAREKAVKKYEKEKWRLEEIQDALEVVQSVLTFLKKDATLREVEEVLKRLVSSEQTKTCFSSIHKAKGLEAENVFLLKPDLLPHPLAKTTAELKQERNLSYVAITRAKEKFFYVRGGENA